MAECRRQLGKNTCTCCNWKLVVLIVLTVLWSYYAYVIELCLFSLSDVIQKIAYLVAFHVLLIMFMWTFIASICQKPGGVPAAYKLSPETLERLENTEDIEQKNEVIEEYARTLHVVTRNLDGSMRYCHICKCVKPDRSHHCSVCGECILRMDHHCPWINNCVGYRNQKIFVIFLFYSTLYCGFITATCLLFLVGQLMREDSLRWSEFQIFLLSVFAAIIGLCVFAFFMYHIFLISVNRTTLEACRRTLFVNGTFKNGFDLGKVKNFRQVFGLNPLLWFMPIFSTPGNGVVFPIRSEYNV